MKTMCRRQCLALNVRLFRRLRSQCRCANINIRVRLIHGLIVMCVADSSVNRDCERILESEIALANAAIRHRIRQRRPTIRKIRTRTGIQYVITFKPLGLR